MNDFRTGLVRGLGNFGATETCGETVAKSTSLSSEGEGVLAIGMPSIMKMSLRNRGEGGEPGSCPEPRDGTGMAGTVADLA